LPRGPVTAWDALKVQSAYMRALDLLP